MIKAWDLTFERFVRPSEAWTQAMCSLGTWSLVETASMPETRGARVSAQLWLSRSARTECDPLLSALMNWLSSLRRASHSDLEGSGGGIVMGVACVAGSRTVEDGNGFGPNPDPSHIGGPRRPRERRGVPLPTVSPGLSSPWEACRFDILAPAGVSGESRGRPLEMACGGVTGASVRAPGIVWEAAPGLRGPGSTVDCAGSAGPVALGF